MPADTTEPCSPPPGTRQRVSRSRHLNLATGARSLTPASACHDNRKIARFPQVGCRRALVAGQLSAQDAIAALALGLVFRTLRSVDELRRSLTPVPSRHAHGDALREEGARLQLHRLVAHR